METSNNDKIFVTAVALVGFYNESKTGKSDTINIKMVAVEDSECGTIKAGSDLQFRVTLHPNCYDMNVINYRRLGCKDDVDLKSPKGLGTSVVRALVVPEEYKGKKRLSVTNVYDFRGISIRRDNASR